MWSDAQTVTLLIYLVNLHTGGSQIPSDINYVGFNSEGIDVAVVFSTFIMFSNVFVPNSEVEGTNFGVKMGSE